MPNAAKMTSSEQTKQVLFFNAKGKLRCCSLLKDAFGAEIFLESEAYVESWRQFWRNIAFYLSCVSGCIKSDKSSPYMKIKK